MISSHDPPLNENGRKKGYVKVMKELLYGRDEGSFSIYEQPKWERIVASTQVGFRVSIWVRIRIRVWIRIRVKVRLGLYFGCSYIEKGPRRGYARLGKLKRSGSKTGENNANGKLVGEY